jgi:hypothetical protein
MSSFNKVDPEHYPSLYPETAAKGEAGDTGASASPRTINEYREVGGLSPFEEIIGEGSVPVGVPVTQTRGVDLTAKPGALTPTGDGRIAEFEAILKAGHPYTEIQVGIEATNEVARAILSGGISPARTYLYTDGLRRLFGGVFPAGYRTSARDLPITVNPKLPPRMIRFIMGESHEVSTR